VSGLRAYLRSSFTSTWVASFVDFEPTLANTFALVFQYISPLKWGVAVLTNLEFTGLTFSCTSAPDQSYPNGTCLVSTGEQVLETLNLEYVDYAMNVGILVGITVISRLIYYVLLKVKLHRMVA
jgi:hypothetical protein